MSRIVAIPVKPFDVAKRLLCGALDPAQRQTLSVELARRTARAAIDAGATPLILSADDAVSEWATNQGHDVLLDEGSSLDEAAHVQVGAEAQSFHHARPEAFDKHGFFTGWMMTIDRLYRCGRDELKHCSWVRVNGELMCFDPLENNDFWWNDADEQQNTEY